MTLKTFSDTPNTFTFNYTFKDFDTAKVAGHALMGYMTGTFEQPAIEVSYYNNGQGGHANQLAVEYVANNELTEVFNRICDSFKDYYNDSEVENDVESQYCLERVEQLKQTESFDSLLEKVARLELELMELADSVLDDEHPGMAVDGVWDNLEAVDHDARGLLKELDTDNNYCALWEYSAE